MLARDEHSSIFVPLVSYTRLEWLARDEHSSLLGPLVSYTRLEWLARDEHSSLLGPLVGYAENDVLALGIQIRNDGSFKENSRIQNKSS
jgi:hypothetical protein